ncbi:GGDEF domain-containing protein [Pseudomonas daroniae]|uniref:diguanylate cyclase n=1 Tax=Phytopseudomonas daroniae TaxID=2487519 RepID=A0A4Q9QMV8_9GAMM|nr:MULTISPECIES: GGDEF domain-containing protein [Pseudomonas]TBU80160.1 GGDEF domain-containing protein [Pseudomonas daroniae]TBU85410.1 GGDEF domain-containing protein [Pseudomonas sp. FRB 228]TBU94257.1 GGDEF domain-containing protein [Pseudomonas daroniae]
MDDDAQRWREKYLSNLEQQEKLERRWDARIDLLRRGLVRSSLAAEGSDKSVDQCMQDLREILRRDDMDVGLSALIPRLEKTVLDSEQRRQQRIEQVASGLSNLVAQLLKMDLPSDVRKPLKRYAKQVDERARQSRELPALLAELSQLQQQALVALGTEQVERPGLIERLFGSRDVANPVAQPEAAAETTPIAQALPPQSTPAAIALVEQPAAAEPALAVMAAPPEGLEPAVAPVSSAAANGIVLLDSLPLPSSLLLPTPAAQPAREPVTEVAEAAILYEATIEEAAQADPEYALPAVPEPGYIAIASHVESSLLGLLEELPLPERHQAQADVLRERITAGLNMYELVPVLDDLGVLMLAIADVGQREFEGYLKQLNERLAAFQGNLGDVRTDYADSTQAARSLDSELRQQVDGLHSSMQEATDLDSLKSLVENRLNGLLGTMAQYQQQRDEREQQVGERLQVLVERVASMELEAKGFRDHLEEQRQKALLDPLTGLPNRAAWTERLDLELARWQRYGGDLLLAVLDIDHFKRINDDFGHLAGDKVLKIIAGELFKRLRKTDFIARFGGEEFVLLIPSTPMEGGLKLLDTLRSAIENCPFHFKGERVTITLSGGIASFSAAERSEQVFERADQALYRAKRSGRNRIEQG